MGVEEDKNYMKVEKAGGVDNNSKEVGNSHGNRQQEVPTKYPEGEEQQRPQNHGREHGGQLQPTRPRLA